MSNLQIQDRVSTEERLKAALWHHVGQMVDAVALQQGLNTTPRFVAGISEMCYAQIENAALDVEAFARHSMRDIITARDVVLLGRRNDGLAAILKAEAEAVKAKDAQ